MVLPVSPTLCMLNNPITPPLGLTMPGAHNCCLYLSLNAFLSLTTFSYILHSKFAWSFDDNLCFSHSCVRTLSCLTSHFQTTASVYEISGFRFYHSKSGESLLRYMKSFQGDVFYFPKTQQIKRSHDGRNRKY